MMEIRLTPEQEAAIRQIAQHEGKTPDQLIFDATMGFYDSGHRLPEVLQERIRKTDAGIFIEEEAMDTRFQKMLP